MGGSHALADESVSIHVEEKVAQSLNDAAGGERGEDAVSARARLQATRRRVGNSMLLAPLLMMRGNQVNHRIALLASSQVWKGHAAAPQLEFGPTANLERAQPPRTGRRQALARSVAFGGMIYQMRGGSQDLACPVCKALRWRGRRLHLRSGKDKVEEDALA